MLNLKSGLDLLKEIANQLASENDDDQDFVEFFGQIIDAAWDKRYHPSPSELENKIKELIEKHTKSNGGDSN